MQYKTLKETSRIEMVLSGEISHTSPFPLFVVNKIINCYLLENAKSQGGTLTRTANSQFWEKESGKEMSPMEPF
jgi:hypothetical protein